MKILDDISYSKSLDLSLMASSEALELHSLKLLHPRRNREDELNFTHTRHSGTQRQFCAAKTNRIF
jgi:hypothetical protein